MKWILYLTLLCCPVFPIDKARTDSIGVMDSLPPMVVTGKAFSMTTPPLQSALERKNAVPGGVTVKNADRFEKGWSANFQDLLENTPGVATQSNGSGEASKVSIRGSGIQSEDQPIGIQFLLDGFPFNQGDGEVSLEDFDLHSLQYAEVYRGANAFKYGAYTLGGAINLVPLTGLSAPPLSLRLHGGSFGGLGGDISIARSKGPLDGYVSVSDQYRDKSRDHSRENTGHVFGDMGLKFGNAENRLYVLFAALDRQSPGGLTKEELIDDPTQANNDALVQDFGTSFKVIRLADKLAWSIKNGLVDVGAIWTYRNQITRSFYSVEDPEGINYLHSNNAALVLNVNDSVRQFGCRADITAGTSVAYENEIQTNFQNLNGQRGDSTASFSDQTINIPVYVEDRLQIMHGLSIIAGFQTIYSFRGFDNNLTADSNAVKSKHLIFLGLNPKFGALYEWNKHNQSFINVCRSWQPPSFENLIALTSTNGAAKQINLEYSLLVPQSAWTAEIGSRHELGRFDGELSLYHSWLSNELLAINDAHGNNIGTANVPKSIHQGIEAGLDIEILNTRIDPENKRPYCGSLLLKQSYTLNDFHFDDNPTYRNNRIAGIPEHFYQADLVYATKQGWYAGPNVQWSMARFPVDQAGILFADPYALIGFSSGFRGEKGLSFYVDARNLANIRYAEGVEPIPDARTVSTEDLQVFYPGDRINFAASIEWRF